MRERTPIPSPHPRTGGQGHSSRRVLRRSGSEVTVPLGIGRHRTELPRAAKTGADKAPVFGGPWVEERRPNEPNKEEPRRLEGAGALERFYRICERKPVGYGAELAVSAEQEVVKVWPFRPPLIPV